MANTTANNNINNKTADTCSVISNWSVITEEETTKVKSLREQLLIRSRKWCNHTSIHGLPNLIRANTYWRFFFWLITMTICLVLCILVVTSNIQDFLRFSVVTKARELPMAKDERFPMVSICNENPFISPAANQYLTEYFARNYAINVSTFDDVLGQLGPRRTSEAFEQILYSMNSPLVNSSAFGYTIDQVITTIWLYGQQWPIETLERFFDPFYGPCVRFNSGMNSSGQPIDRELLAVSGIGLNIVIFIGVSDDMRDYIYQPPNRGIRVEVKDVDGYPFISDAVVVSPGISSSIIVSKHHSSILPQPYSECLDISNANAIGSLPSHIQQIIAGLRGLNITYTRNYCTELLIQSANIAQLNCYDLRLLNYRADVQPCANVSLLSHKDTQLVDNKDCPLECETTWYTFDMSQDIFPSYLVYEDTLINEADEIQQLFGTSNVSYEIFRKSFTSIDVYFQDLTVMDLSESIKVDTVALVSNLGGSIGIFLGVSLLTAVECVELILVLGFIVLKYIKFNQSKSKS